MNVDPADVHGIILDDNNLGPDLSFFNESVFPREFWYISLKRNGIVTLDDSLFQRGYSETLIVDLSENGIESLPNGGQFLNSASANYL